MDNVITFPVTLSAIEAEKIIKELTALGNITWTKHCKLRMLERDITIQEILNCLLKGNVTEEPLYTFKNGGGYETRVEKGTAGNWLRVVVCLKDSQKMVIITAIN